MVENAPEPAPHPAVRVVHPGLLPVHERVDQVAHQSLITAVENLGIPVPMTDDGNAPRLQNAADLGREGDGVRKALKEVAGVCDIEFSITER